MAKLFDSGFLRRLEALRYAARRVPSGGRHAAQRSSSTGGGVEFADYRSYAQGEDMRRVDWNVWRRFGKLFLRTFVEDLDLPVHVVLDLSASIFLQPEREQAARMAAAAFAWVGVTGNDRVRIHPFGSQPLPAYGPVSARSSGLGMLSWLAALPAAGQTRMTDTLKRIRGVAGRRGLLVLISDFFNADGLGPVLAELSRQRHQVLMVQLHHPDDAAPPLRGEVRVVDCETGEHRDVTITPDLLRRYGEVHGDFEEQLHKYAREGRAGIVKIDVTKDVLAQVEPLFLGGRLQV